ncbi:MAG: SOS response-associated peptidase [Chloroflexota bacterium]|nr:SOS response-associated peptidase [Chloroflexota bacterium]
MTQQTSPSEVARIFHAELSEDEPVPPRFNCAPTDPLTVVLEREDGRVVERHRWGLIPHWAADPSRGSRMINARAETVATSPAFRGALRRRRCIVPSDGFYEWERRGSTRQPWLIRRADREPMAMAGLWSLWRDPGSDLWISTCAVITTVANTIVAPLHERMPVLLPKDAWDAWVDPGGSSAELLRELMVPAGDDVLERHPVSQRVNDVRNEGPGLIEPEALSPSLALG